MMFSLFTIIRNRGNRRGVLGWFLFDGSLLDARSVKRIFLRVVSTPQNNNLIPTPKKGSSRLMVAVRSLAPNAGWDAIKETWRLFRESPYYSSAVNGAFTLVGTSITAILARVYGMPPDVQGILIIGGVWLLILSIVFMFGRLKGRRSVTAPVKAASTTTEIAAPAEAEHARGLQALKDHIKDLEDEQAANKWLLDIAKQDKNHIPSAIAFTKVKVRHKPDNEPNPYIDFTFTVFNGSVYCISLEFDLNKSIYFNGSELGGRVKLESNEVLYTTHAKYMNFTLRLILMNPREAETINNVEYPNDVFTFGEIIVKVVSGDERSDLDLRSLGVVRGRVMPGVRRKASVRTQSVKLD